ncbi:MAG: sialidase family protein, partial [Pirellulaceae bacterium]
MMLRFLLLLASSLGAILTANFASSALAVESPDVIRVVRPRVLKVSQLSCVRIPFGQPEDYKPSLIQLKNGDLLVVLFRGERLENGKINETPVLYRSTDEGLTWSAGEVLALKGREPYLSISDQGTLFITAHLLSQD